MIRTYLTNTTSANIRESECRVVTREICYPAISSCISITLVNANIMVGIHCTVANTAHEIRNVMCEIKRTIAEEFTDCYVVGALPIFKSSVFDHSISTRKKISNVIRPHIKILNSIKFHDTTMHPNINKNAHIFIRNAPFSISYCAAVKCLVSGQIPPLSFGRQYIPSHQFTKVNSISNMILCL